MAIYEIWIEQSQDGKFIGYYSRIPPEKNDASYATSNQTSRHAAALAIREQLRKFATATDQFRIKNRTNIYSSINDALEDIIRS